jgi:alkylated DNA nucleotide flippase Atl1
MVNPRSGAAATRIRRRRERSAVVRIVDSGELDDGTDLVLSAPADVPADDVVAIERWVGAHPAGARATWRNDRARPIEWKLDGKGYRPTPLVREIVGRAGLTDRPLSGSSWWMLSGGETLAQVGARIGGGFDWTPLHAILAHLPEGHWTTYGDLADTVNTGPVALGQHLSTCSQCLNAWRVLGAEGRPRGGFKWSDPKRTESQEDALVSEGVTFTNGRADDERRLRPSDLAALMGAGAGT